MPYRERTGLPFLLKRLENLEEMARVNYDALLEKVEDRMVREKLEAIREDEERHRELVEKAISLL